MLGYLMREGVRQVAHTGVDRQWGCLACETKWWGTEPDCWLCGTVGVGVPAFDLGPGINSQHSYVPWTRHRPEELDDLTGAPHP